VNLIRIYQCLCDETRLRILHLLVRGPLCVCHFQTVLGEPQVKISKHLNYLKSRGLVESLRHENWRIYKLPESQSYELEKHLKCLQDCIQETNLFREDLQRLKAVKAEAAEIAAECCGPQEKRGRTNKNACC
jgi:ArsR family transcriptional regulator, arsenate/arsenite/antimonite-responsive transcriptional repressor